MELQDEGFSRVKGCNILKMMNADPVKAGDMPYICSRISGSVVDMM